jgi:cell division protein FtsI/penicillin-binding protein 2
MKRKSSFNWRPFLILFIFHISLVVVIFRLYFCQVVEHEKALTTSDNQYHLIKKFSGDRGQIYSSDGFLMSGNRNYYRFFIDLNMVEDRKDLVSKIYPLLEGREDIKPTGFNDYHQLEQKIATHSGRICYLANKVDDELKEKIISLKIVALGFDSFQTRIYPEATMAAHLLGFVGKNSQGAEYGYYGIEGYFNQELKPEVNKKMLQVDALKRPLFINKILSEDELSKRNGRDIVLSLRKDVQTVIEHELQKGLKITGSDSGEVVVYQPQTGKILGLASYPNYSPAEYYEFDSKKYKNPSLVDFYEPGSVMKVLTVAAGLNEGLINPQTTCPVCAGPRQIGAYKIRTWNNRYIPNIDMTTALKKSDNTAMVYISDLLGKERMKKYFSKFGFGHELNIELQEDVAPPFPQTWRPIEVANRSFGQGILVNTLQMTRSVAGVINDGFLTKPSVVEKIVDQNLDYEYIIEPVIQEQAISTESSRLARQMMIETFAYNEPKWLYQGQEIAGGKSGTAQIPNPDGGGYLEGTTLASFIGFAPTDNPKFVLYVKLIHPKNSQWSEATARPIWHKIAEKLLIML